VPLISGEYPGPQVSRAVDRAIGHP